MKRILLALFALLQTTSLNADQLSEFQLATKFRYWGNAENYRMEQAFQRIGLPDDGCWEDKNSTTLCAITLDRQSVRFPFCDKEKYVGNFPIFIDPSSCKIADQMDNLILLRLEKRSTRDALKIDMYVCRHATGSDSWPKPYCNVKHELEPDWVSNILKGFQRIPDLQDRLIKRNLVQ